MAGIPDSYLPGLRRPRLFTDSLARFGSGRRLWPGIDHPVPHRKDICLQRQYALGSPGAYSPHSQATDPGATPLPDSYPPRTNLRLSPGMQQGHRCEYGSGNTGADNIAVLLATLVADYRHRLGVQEVRRSAGHSQTHGPVPPSRCHESAQAAGPAMALTLIPPWRKERQIVGTDNPQGRAGNPSAAGR